MLLGLLAESCFIKVVAEQTKLLGTAKAHDPFPLHPAQGCWSCWNLLTHTQLTWLFTSASSTPRLIYRPPTPSNNGEIYEGHLVLFVYCQEENVILFLIPYFTSPPSQPLPQLMSPFTIFSCVLEEVTLVPSYLFHTSGKHWISLFFPFGCCAAKLPPAPDVASVLWAEVDAWSSWLKKAPLSSKNRESHCKPYNLLYLWGCSLFYEGMFPSRANFEGLTNCCEDESGDRSPESFCPFWLCSHPLPLPAVMEAHHS